MVRIVKKKGAAKALSLHRMLLIASSLITMQSTYASVEEFVEYNAPEIVINNVTLIDGTGASAKKGQSIVIKNGKIEQINSAENITVSDSAQMIDGTGKSVIPGLVMMHEHMFYPTGKSHYTEMLYSFPKLYLAGGATTIRTAGTTAPYADLNLKQAIIDNKTIGPDIDVTAPYLNGPGLPLLKINIIIINW